VPFTPLTEAQDTLKVSGTQVSPNEIEDALAEQPDDLITDATVAGVQGDRMEGELVPRAWIILSAKGKSAGADKVMAILDAWVKDRLSKPKWLRGGIEIVNEARAMLFEAPAGALTSHVSRRSPSRRLARYFAVYYKSVTIPRALDRQ
jgi:acyl-CoA synthetase (AMP-forming)/AMP-acid ligase II